GAAGCGAAACSASVSRCQARVRSLRATAVVAIFFPRRLAMAGGEWGVPLGGLRRLAQHPAQPRRALFGDVPVVGDAVAAADGRWWARPTTPVCAPRRTG